MCINITTFPNLFYNITIINIPNQQRQIRIMQLPVPFDQFHVTVRIIVMNCPTLISIFYDFTSIRFAETPQELSVLFQAMIEVQYDFP